MPTRTALTTELFSTVGRFRRQLRRSAPRGFEGAGLTEAQAELLRLVGRRPGTSVSEAAAELGLVANSASTLVSKLLAHGLVLREPDPDDRRIGRLRLTAPAQRIADQSRSARHAALAEVLEKLDPAEIDTLTGGLAVLGKLTRLLDERKL
jgi:DNA-binding MarR family transcriptional regulator